MSLVVEATEAVPAADLGPSRFPWWPDWRGKCAAVIASGPSAKMAKISGLRGKMPVIAVKDNVELAPWADAVYGCDSPWWKNNQGLPKYHGLKLSYAKELPADYPEIKIIEIDKPHDVILFDVPGVIGSAGNSGFQALNLAVQFGATRILLIGFDMHDRSGVHWFGRNNGLGRNNPDMQNFRRWIAGFTASAPLLERRGIDVVNASPITALQCFRRQSVMTTLAEWGFAA